MRFSDRTVLVTGAGRGIGRSIALRFGEEGAKVALVARTESDLKAVAAAIAKCGGKALVIPDDITRKGAPEEAVERTEKELGVIDVLVNNAGLFLYKPFLTLTEEEWDRVMATDLTATARFCRAVLPRMAARKSGRIVNVSSIHGMRGDANVAAQSAAKFGLIGLTQSLAREFRAQNIAINAVCPGSVENKIDETGAADRAAPLGEKLWPRDVAKTVLFLASDDAAAITGVALEVFGGTHLTIKT